MCFLVVLFFIIETVYNSDDSPRKKIDDLIHLAELCIELLQQDAEHYQEAFLQYQDLLIEHEEIFWSLFAVDMEHVIDQQPIESWDSFPLFQLLNDYLRTHGNYFFVYIYSISNLLIQMHWLAVDFINNYVLHSHH